MARTKQLRIASIASEVAPFSKTGGLADVAIALPTALSKMGHKVSIITPYYSFIKKQDLTLKDVDTKTSVTIGKKKYSIAFKRLTLNENVNVFFINSNRLFGRRTKVYGYPDDNLRFLVFNIAALKFLEILTPRRHIIHCHDWQAGIVPDLLRRFPKKYPASKKAATIFTVHNLTFQSANNWWGVEEKDMDDGKGDPIQRIGNTKYLNFTQRGILYSDVINTVSERYAEEITTPEFGQGLDRLLRSRKKYLHGIINGIDYAVNNPAFDSNIAFKYDWNSLRRKKKNKLELQKIVGLERNPDIPLIGVVNRLTEQKGFNLIMESIDVLMRQKLQIVIVGSGFKEYILFFKKYARKFPKKLGIYTPFTEAMESKVYAGSDMFLMPSRFEPCGISQLKSLRYGSIPIVHETGGLSDTISNYNPKTRKGNGFVFKHFGREEFLIALTRALENYKYTQAWETLTWNAMQQTYSWELPAKKYISLYAIAKKNKDIKK